ncbi:exopolysaccharide synthesis ExoD-like protein [Wolbachia endosymbiont of Culex quinquefasciatus JHB]|uniref:exopolysaccharide biosynthesis protein n=1 Tax=Wolbachia TaxID=953 RepID=UPI0001761C70|nr:MULTISPECIES: exopolysaccharide biosynthesis protein [Wolbachia]MBS9531037.1 exopolysaccharide biosynthesis protein [Wolbachia endosymbiont of Rhagoletis cerasi]EEB55957.1 exopolysaccharide synthesis ExoD-like protein [Wolbachia endosymbiont of Culex quinquefasciatus JHB]QEK89930.1 exopolysaccharide biosynthesis protein exod [Wolbachia endosymbiont of Chrysomya megacephala]QJT94978.1 exopolysaccharide biosynthesis protein [Wolbachia endosymbiont of Diaphorina citri]QJT96079.1 exopolysacchar
MEKSVKLTEDKKLASDILKEVADTNNNDNDKVTLFDIKTALHERGFGILIIIFSLPLSVPIPVPPGYTTILSIPLILFSLQLLFGFDSPWMPNWLERKSFQRSTLALVVEKTSPTLKKIEKFMKPRMSFIFRGPGENILAFIMLLCALSIAIPLPLTNFIPAIGTTLISLGIMSKDGFLSIMGVLVSLCGLLLTLVVIVKGPQLIFGAFSFLKSFVYG